jgi:hypothetical protein
MSGPRLTGLEFSWFTKCQMLASDYEQHWGMQLEPGIVRLVACVAADARTSFTGPQSLRRVAERLVLAADAFTLTMVDQSIGPNRRLEIDRRVVALHTIAERLVSVAAVVETWKHSSGRSPEAHSAQPAFPTAL